MPWNGYYQEKHKCKTDVTKNYRRWVEDIKGEKLIEVKNLKTYFFTDEGISKAVEGVDFEIYDGETLGLVGESGCGKSVTALSILRLLEMTAGKIVSGQILFKGQDLVQLNQNAIRKIRGKDISMIFQDPMTSLDPVFTIGEQISETIMLHKKVNEKEAMKQSIEMLRKVGIPLPEQRINEYPHQLSGGMRQRVMIAIALSCGSKLLIADEPTTALDVTIQAQILDLINEIKHKFGMSILMITHSMGVIAEIADHVAVMYAGKIVEYTDVKKLFSNPMHPYTWGLLNCIPRPSLNRKRLMTIPGVVPSSYNYPEGCHYNLRCPIASDICFEREPGMEELERGHKVSCWNYKQLEEFKKVKTK